MEKINQSKIPITIDEGNLLKIAQEQGAVEQQFNWKLVREHDNLTMKSKEVIWIEFDKEGRFRESYDNPDKGISLVMSPFNVFYTWQTTPIVEVLEQKEDYIRFKTGNSVYKLYKI